MTADEHGRTPDADTSDLDLSTPLGRATASRRAQGLPDTIEDPAVLARVAELLTVDVRSPRRGAA